MPNTRIRAVSALGVIVALTAFACSSSKKSSSSPTTARFRLAGTTAAASGATAPATVNLGYNADMQVPDPDIFYEIEGNSVMTSVYEGLVRYGTTRPRSCRRWRRAGRSSPDGLTYTFHLRPGVTFHDGRHDDLERRRQASFKRRTALGSVSAPSYMLADVTSYDTPDP